MPELNLPFGYPLFWGVCLLLVGGMLIFFKHRRWL
jgi:Mg2+ and Co2+ transporter CorA